jgi:hypothetical protein
MFSLDYENNLVGGTLLHLSFVAFTIFPFRTIIDEEGNKPEQAPYRTIVDEEGNKPEQAPQESPGILQLIDQLEEIADKLLMG